MEIENWLTQVQNDETALSDFIERLKPYISNNGFNGAEFERKVNIGILNASKEVDDLFKTTEDATDQ
jgi:hypothetical protein